MPRLSREALQKKILDNVIPDENGCWIWQKSFGSHGYGNIATGGHRNETVHRVSHEVFIGEIPKGQLVLHSCDNRKCCNPEHLRSGTYKDNSSDAISRGRNKLPPVMIGSDHVNAKLTEEEVLEIYMSTLSQRKLAALFGVSQKLIHCIKRGKAWQHVTQHEELNV